MAYRRLTSNRKIQINRLVEIIESFLPFSTWKGSSSNTFKSVFAESNVDKYLKGNSKRERLINGFSTLYQQHQQLPYKILRKVIARGAQYRKYKRNPIKDDEIEELRDCLESLEIDIDKELSDIELNPNLPDIEVPPDDLVDRMRNHPLVDEIRYDSLRQFEDGYFNESVRKACEKFEAKVREISGTAGTGSGLMGTVFNPQNPQIAINDLQTENDQNEQEGFQKLAMGMMSGIRNIFSHGDEDRLTPEEAFEMLMFINWMFRKLKG